MNSKACHVLLLLLPLLATGGCRQTEVRTDTLDQLDQELEQAVKTNEAAADRVPEEVSRALLPEISLDTAEVPQVEDEQRFDISVNDVPAEQFFMGLVDGTPYNMVVHPEVKGRITLHLKNVTIPQVMEAVRDVYGYEFVRNEYGFQVLPGRLSARIYQINYLNVERAGSSSTFVSGGTLTQGPNAPGVEVGAGQAGTESSTVSRSRTNVIGTQIQTRQPQTTFWRELGTSIRAIIGNGEGRSVVVNPQTGVVVVRALPSEQREVEAYLKATQLVVQRQVILEAKLVEVTLSDGFQSGIDWSALAGNYRAFQVGGGSILKNQAGRSVIDGNTGNLDPGQGLLPDGGAISAFGGMFALAVDAANFRAFIELLQTQGNVQVLSSPRVSTLNNQKALIKVGTDEFFVTDISTTTVTGTATTTSPDVELTPFFSGIALDVTPQISGDDEVTLHIHPSVSQVVDQTKTITVGSATATFPLARSTVRESDSVVRARSGQIVVIGGLMQDRIDDADASVPLLGDIPGLGELFKHRRKQTAKSELVILLRPIVVNDSGDWTKDLRMSRQRMDRLRGELERRRIKMPAAAN